MAKIVRRWSPLQEIVSMREQMDRLFEDSLGSPRLRWQEPTNWGLALDVAEGDSGFTVMASIPGVDPNDVEVTLTDNVLTIKGEMKANEEIKQDQYHIRERRYGQFERSITLSVPVNADAIDATYENGILTLSIPKAEEVKPRRISINAKSTKVLEG